MTPERPGVRRAPPALEPALRRVLGALLDRHRAMADLRAALPPDDRSLLDLAERRLTAAEDSLVRWLGRRDQGKVPGRPGPPGDPDGHGL